jgi:WD40 repeat protein
MGQISGVNSAKAYSVAFARGGQELVVGTQYGARIWNTTNGEYRGSLPFSLSGVAAAGEVVATIRGDLANIWDLGLQLTPGRQFGNTIPWIDLSADGQHLATGVNTISVWNTATGAVEHDFVGATLGADRLDLSDDGQILLEMGRSQLLNSPIAVVWDVTTETELQRFPAINAPSIPVIPIGALSPDGGSVALQASTNGVYELVLYDSVSGAVLRRFDTGRARSVVFSPDGRYVAVGIVSAVQLWDVTTGQLARTFLGNPGAITALTFSPDGSLLLSGGASHDRGLRIWDVATGRHRWVVDTNAAGAMDVAFSPSGRLFGVATDVDVQVFDTLTGRVIARFNRSGGTGQSIRFRSENEMIVSLWSGYGRIVELWSFDASLLPTTTPVLWCPAWTGSTPTATSTSTPTKTSTPTSTITSTPTTTETNTPTSTQTSTSTATAIASATATSTSTNTVTSTPTTTSTPTRTVTPEHETSHRSFLPYVRLP